MWWLLSRLCFVCVIATIDMPKLSPTITGLVKSTMMVSLALVQRAYDAVVSGKQPVTRAKIIVIPEENMWWILFRVLGHLELNRVPSTRVVMPERICRQNMFVVLATSYLFIQTDFNDTVPDGSVVVACTETESLLSALVDSEAFVTIDPLNKSALVVEERRLRTTTDPVNDVGD